MNQVRYLLCAGLLHGEVSDPVVLTGLSPAWQGLGHSEADACVSWTMHMPRCYGRCCAFRSSMVSHGQEEEGQSRKTVCTFMLQSFCKLCVSALGEIPYAEDGGKEM